MRAGQRPTNLPVTGPAHDVAPHFCTAGRIGKDPGGSGSPLARSFNYSDKPAVVCRGAVLVPTPQILAGGDTAENLTD